MVSDAGAPAGADAAERSGLRPLNQPRPVTVITRGPDQHPAILLDRGQRRPIARVQDMWQIDDEWWRDPIRRRYYQVVLADGTLRTLFHDLAADRWYEQGYA